ncbi:MAG: family 43 glycosylhydrolase [Bacteroidota bacterium]
MPAPRFVLISCLALLAYLGCQGPPAQLPLTICNPMDLSYRFMPEEPSRREAADPSVIRFQDEYYLFASKSGGYWVSGDLAQWEFIQTDQIPTEEYAPTAMVLRDTVFFMASSKTRSRIFKSANPRSGQWQIAKDSLAIPVWDPAFFQDEDGQLYLYWGCSNVDPLYGVKLDDQSFEFKSEVVKLLFPHPELHGWEIRGDYNTQVEVSPWIEGPWMNKHQGKYYLQYAAPGTLEKSYSDAVYIGNSPLGPFKPALHNPFAYKPEGFACGAGHGSTFSDSFGNYWHAGTVPIAVRHKFERRLGIYPSFFDEDQVFYTYTRFGDYPMQVPGQLMEDPEDLFMGWMLVSYGKKALVSSSIDSLGPENLNDEEIRTYWSAQTGNPDEWAGLDLGEPTTVRAIQVNFAEHNTQLKGRVAGIRHAYLIETSSDGSNWQVLIDQSESQSDRSHVYHPLDRPIETRYLRVRNVAVPDGTFALSGLRVFGHQAMAAPEEVDSFYVQRDPVDPRSVHLSWASLPEADGYNIRYGIAPDKLYHNYLVYGQDQVTIRSLHLKHRYFFAIEAFNAGGVGPLKDGKTGTDPL